MSERNLAWRMELDRQQREREEQEAKARRAQANQSPEERAAAEAKAKEKGSGLLGLLSRLWMELVKVAKDVYKDVKRRMSGERNLGEGIHYPSPDEEKGVGKAGSEPKHWRFPAMAPSHPAHNHAETQPPLSKQPDFVPYTTQHLRPHQTSTVSATRNSVHGTMAENTPAGQPKKPRGKRR